MKVNIRVTKNDISNGRPRSAAYCPVALAFRRRLAGMGVSPNVGRYTVVLYNSTQFESVFLPRAATVKIANFDGGKSIKPFSFSIDIPAWWLKESKKS